MFLVPLLSEGLREVQPHGAIRKRILEAILICLLVGLLPLIYWFSRDAGISRAKIDKGSATLPTVSFTIAKQPHRGQLLFVRNGIYFVHNVEQNTEPKVQEISIFRSEEVSDMKIVEFK